VLALGFHFFVALSYPFPRFLSPERIVLSVGRMSYILKVRITLNVCLLL